MKIWEYILHGVGLILLILSILFYFGKEITFVEGSIIGGIGLALIVFNISQIREYLKKIIDKYLNK